MIGSGYAAIKLLQNTRNEFSSVFNFKLIDLEIVNKEGKIIIENSCFNRVVLTFEINHQKDVEILNELQNSIK